MMQFRKTGVLLLAFLFTYAVVKSDVPPEPGYVRQRASLILETQEDLSDYRFFIESPIRIEEITIIKGQRTVIDASGRGGAARIGTLWAIPRIDLGDYEVSNTKNLEGLRKDLREGANFPTLMLLSHGFQTTVREDEKAGWKDPVYRIEKDPELRFTNLGLKAVLISGGANESKPIITVDSPSIRTKPKRRSSGQQSSAAH